ncbi:hypothetical protein FZZ89_00490 [Synechococcus sp. HBA1120]|nr:hypothetical protein [Synechococcus sp. HBA1120]
MSFRPDPSPENACWLLIRTDHHEPPRPLAPVSHRRAPKDDAIKTRAFSWLLLLDWHSMASISQESCDAVCRSWMAIDRLLLRNRFSCERQFGSTRPNHHFTHSSWRLAAVELLRRRAIQWQHLCANGRSPQRICDLHTGRTSLLHALGRRTATRLQRRGALVSTEQHDCLHRHLPPGG